VSNRPENIQLLTEIMSQWALRLLGFPFLLQVRSALTGCRGQYTNCRSLSAPALQSVKGVQPLGYSVVASLLLVDRVKIVFFHSLCLADEL